MDSTRDKVPESEENRTQEPPHSIFPQDAAQKQGKKTGQPQITPADAEHIIKPHPSCTNQKQQITENRVPWPQRAQKSIPQSQKGTQSKACQKSLGSNDRFCHPNSLRQPLSRGSS